MSVLFAGIESRDHGEALGGSVARELLEKRRRKGDAEVDGEMIGDVEDRILVSLHELSDAFGVLGSLRSGFSFGTTQRRLPNPGLPPWRNRGHGTYRGLFLW